MSRSYRIRNHPYLALIPLVALLLVSSYYSHDQEPATPYGGEHNEHAGDHQAWAVSVPVSEVASYSAAQENPSNQDEASHRGLIYGDTLAQWVMAVGTIATVALVMWTLFVTKGMLREARLATKAAVQAAKSTDATVAETRRIGEAQVRAYLKVSFNRVSFNGPDGRKAIKLSGSINNTGVSPAFHLVAAGMISTQKPEFEDINRSKIKHFPFNSFVAPGHESDGFSVVMPFSDHGIEESSAASLWCVVLINYVDVFEAPCRTYYRAKIVDSNGKKLSIKDFKSAFSGGFVKMQNG